MHDHDRGLSHDLPLITRRRALATVTGGLGALLVGCGSSQDGATPTATAGETAAVPEETGSSRSTRSSRRPTRAAGRYEQRVENLGGTSLESDMVFGDGYASRLAKASGDVERGIALSLNVGV